MSLHAHRCFPPEILESAVGAAVTLRGARCQCPVCGEYFTRARWFDRHRVGPYTDRRCLSAPEIEALGLVQRQVGAERLWSGPRMPLEALTARRQAVQAAEEVG